MKNKMYYSQFEQDKFLNEFIFKNKKNGVFLEIGADDGIKNSNTLFFERNLDWRGICFEPRPDAYAKLTQNRKSICLNICLAEDNRPRKFLSIDGECAQYSGVCSKLEPEHIKRIETDTQKLNSSKKIIEVACDNLNNVLANHKISHVDYCSIDTEGGELDILKTIDFLNTTINVISVENNFGDRSIKKFLKKNGYYLMKVMGPDEIYLRDNEDNNLPRYQEPFSLQLYFFRLKKKYYGKILRIIPGWAKNIIKILIK